MSTSQTIQRQNCPKIGEDASYWLTIFREYFPLVSNFIDPYLLLRIILAHVQLINRTVPRRFVPERPIRMSMIQGKSALNLPTPHTRTNSYQICVILCCKQNIDSCCVLNVGP